MKALWHILPLSYHYVLSISLCLLDAKDQQTKDYRWLSAGCVGDIEGKFQPKWHIVRLPSSWHPIKGDRLLDL